MELHDLVTIKKNPRYRNIRSKAIGGFISDVSDHSVEVCLLDDEGNLVDCLDFDPEALSDITPQKLQDAFDAYQRMLDEIHIECVERGKQYKLTQQALAKKYSLSEDEIYAIYRAMLNFESYYAEFLT